MCGILGSVNIELQKSDLDLLNHRGPDNQELKTFEQANQQVFLGHTRLSIVDLSEAGNQPMPTCVCKVKLFLMMRFIII